MTPQEHFDLAKQFLAQADQCPNEDVRAGLIQTAALQAMLGILASLLQPPPPA